MITRCAWVGDDPLLQRYHDEEWGVPVHDDRMLFEFLALSGAQAGLSWLTILRKRGGYRKAFAGFEIKRVARFTEARVRALLSDPGIVRNEQKVRSAIRNARAALRVQGEFGSLDAYLWGFVNGKPIVKRRRTVKDIPPGTKVSAAMSQDMKRRGFSFVGSTICYAFMQSVGMVNDHTVHCFTHGGRPRRARA
jgi:DNA-3-methyladenine glycosylase I